jgi:hypothetical protein
MSSQRKSGAHASVGTTIPKKSDNTAGRCTGRNESKLVPSNSNRHHNQLKVKSTVKIINPQTKIDPFNHEILEDIYIPSIQSTQLNKQDEIASVAYFQRLLNIMKQHDLVFQPVNEPGRDVHVDGPDQLELIVCTGHGQQDESSENCKCNKYYPSKFQILGSRCSFCNHSIRFH